MRGLVVLLVATVCGLTWRAAPAYAGVATAQNLAHPTAQVPAPDMAGYVRVDDGADIYFTVRGEGPPLLLLHGGAGHLGHWALQTPIFSESYRVISIDSRGHGRSTRTAAPITYHRMAADVLAVMDALSIERASIVGWSDGGNIGIDIAINNPKRINRLFAFGSNYDPAGLDENAGKSQTVIDFMARAEVDYAAHSKTPDEFDAFMAQLTAMWSTEPKFSQEELVSISTPVMICAGQLEEVITERHTRELAAMIPEARLLILQGSSHFGPWQTPNAFNEAVMNFLHGNE